MTLDAKQNDFILPPLIRLHVYHQNLQKVRLSVVLSVGMIIRKAADKFSMKFQRGRSRDKITQIYDLFHIFIIATHFYRAMHFSACARSWDRTSSVRPSVCPSVRPSVTLVDCDHIGWKSWKLVTRTTRPTTSLFVAKMRST